MQALGFRCTGCGNCCRSLRVAVTAHDVERLMAATGRRASELCAWLAPDAVDMTGEPQSFVELGDGRRLLVLAQQAGACVLLDAHDRCTAYEARPLDCRAFPFDFEQAADGHRHLRLLPMSGCDHAHDGQHSLDAVSTLDRERWQALLDYQARVASWNRLAKHRRRLGHPIGNADAFLDFALAHEAVTPR